MFRQFGPRAREASEGKVLDPLIPVLEEVIAGLRLCMSVHHSTIERRRMMKKTNQSGITFQHFC